MNTIQEDMQKLFSMSVRGLAAQGWKQAVDMVRRHGQEKASCVLRAPDGTKCAIGHLISDEVYKPQLETLQLSSTEMIQAIEKSTGVAVRPAVRQRVRTLLIEMQCAHDYHHDFIEGRLVISMEQRFEHVARVFRLSWPNDEPQSDTKE